VAKILLVEDDLQMREFIQACLVSDRHVVDLAETGREALLYLENREYDVIVLDWTLPDIAGLEVCKQYRHDRGNAFILMLTAKDKSTSKAMALDSGADDYLVKPCDSVELLARVRALLRRPRQIAERSLTVGGIALNTDTLEVLSNGRKVVLTPKEADILALLMRNANKYLTAESIFTRLWQSDSSTASSETIRTHIKELRRKLADQGNMIKSARNLGYRIVGEDAGDQH
jgi:DNA-binding response OmpR family regulator